MTTLPRFITTLALASTLALPPAAQTPTPPPTTSSSEPHVVVVTVGPDGWRTRLGPTNLGGLLASANGRAAWEPQVEPLLARWQQALGAHVDFAAARDRLLGYGGRVRLAAWVRAAAGAADPDLDVAIVLEPDGRTDLARLAADVRELQRSAAGEWREQQLDGRALDVCLDGRDAVSAPFPAGDAIVVLYSRGGDMTRVWADARAFAGTTAAPSPAQPPLRVDIDVARLVALSAADADATERGAASVFGLDSLARARLVLGTAGPRVQLELEQRFAPAPRGLFAALFPPATDVSPLRAALPQLGSARVGHFDWAALFDTVVAAVDLFVDEDGFDARSALRDELGFDVRDDVVAHTATGTLVTGASLAQLDRFSDFTWTVAVALRDMAAFRTGLTALIAKTKPALSHEATVDHDGVECHRYGNFLGYDLWLAVGHGAFVFGGGADAERELARVLAALPRAAAAPSSTPVPAAPPPPWLVELERHLPPGLNGYGRGELGSLVQMPLHWWVQGLGELVPMPLHVDDDDDATRARWYELLQAHDLLVLRSATGHDGSAWRARLYW